MNIQTESEFFQFEMKELSDEGTFEGYAATYHKDLGGDVIEHGAFAETLKESGGRVPILFNHSWMRPIGYGLDAKEDEHGLWVKGEFTLDSTDGRDAYATAKHAQRRKQRHGLSIGYSIAGEGGAEMRGQVRRLKALNLHEYSLAIFPMNPKARIREVKSGATLRECEEYLRGFGMSQTEAKTFLSAVEAARDVSASGSSTRDVDGDKAIAALLSGVRDFTLQLKLREFARHHG